MEHLSEAGTGGDHYGRGGEEFSLFDFARGPCCGTGIRHGLSVAYGWSRLAVPPVAAERCCDRGRCVACVYDRDFHFLPDHATALCLLQVPDPQHEGDWAGLAALQ